MKYQAAFFSLLPSFHRGACLALVPIPGADGCTQLCVYEGPRGPL